MAKTKPELRFEFVGMMFAVAVGEIGIKFGLMAQHPAPGGANKFAYAFPAIFHLLMAALIVAVSWVGWSRSDVSVSISDVTSAFSKPFLVLLLDVLLVVCYFIIVDTVELTVDDQKSTFNVTPSARGESFWIFIMFCGYALWDVLTKVFIKPGEGEEPHPYRKRGWVSILLVLFALVAWTLFRNVSGYWPVIVADVALIALLLLFRSLKDFVTAYQLKNTEGKPQAEFLKYRNSAMEKPGIWSVVLLALAVVATMFACEKGW